MIDFTQDEEYTEDEQIEIEAIALEVYKYALDLEEEE